MKQSALDELLATWPHGDGLRAALTQPFRRCVRRHPRRGTLTNWHASESVPWSASGFFHSHDIDPATRLDYHTGAAYAQDAASQIPVLLLDPQPGETIIDCCAAPGSKTTQIGLALGDEGLVVAADASPPRRKVLAETLARQGVISGVVTPLPLERLVPHAAHAADGVLVDAPCSGHVERSPKQVQRMAARQLGILTQAAGLVASGGRLVYSTCTPYSAENEGVIQAFVTAHPGWQIEPVSLPGCDPDFSELGAIRMWPHRQGTEPFFACRLRAPQHGEYGSLRGDLPPSHVIEHMPGTWHAWQRGRLTLAASEAAARCALPSDARGLILMEGERMTTWGAQALIARGVVEAAVISHEQACEAWAGAQTPALVGARFARTEPGAPLAAVDADGGLIVPSRLRRQVSG